jgi:hypothetical protein
MEVWGSVVVMGNCRETQIMVEDTKLRRSCEEINFLG